MRIRGIALVVVFVLLGPIPTAAQSGGLIVRVKGPLGPLSGADVEVLYPGILMIRGETDQNGTAPIRPIPPGTYDVTVRLLGHTTAEERGVRVEPGVPRVLEFTLQIAPVELEGITVRADRIEIERETVEFATALEEEAIDLLPVSREARELVALTPGARADHVWGGASAQANSYRIDGLSTNNPGQGADLFKPSPLWIAGVDVRGLGAGAEYGGFQGGLVDVTTKSGTNRFEGSLRSTVEHDWLTGSNLVPVEVGREVVGRLDLEGEVRGPLLRDRLFYYLSGQRVAQDRRALNHLGWVGGRYAPIYEERTEHRAYGKVSWTPSLYDLVELSAAYTDTQAENHDLNGYEEDGATYRYSSPAWVLSARGHRIFEGWGRLDAGLNHLRSDERSAPYRGRSRPGITNYTPTPPHSAFGNAPLFLRSAPTSTSGSLMGTVRFRVGGAEHSLKIGAEYSRGSFLNERTRNSGMTWAPGFSEGFDPEDPSTWYTGEGEIPTLWGGEVRVDADVANGGAFAQATIALGSRIVLSPGIRWGRWKGWVTPTSGERFLAVQDDGWDPRVGVSVDLTGHGTLVAKAHWGRYHQSMITQMFDRASGGDAFTNEEFWHYAGDPFSDPGRGFTRTERDSMAARGLFRKVGEVVLNETGPVEGYRQPYVEQWLVGLEKKVHRSAKFEFLYTRRSNRDMVALVDLNREANYTSFSRVYPNGCIYLAGGCVVIQELFLPNNAVLQRLRCLADGSCPGALEIPGLTPADTLGLFWDPRYVLTTAPGAKREYSQLQVSLELSRPDWGGTFSLVRMDLRGNLDNVSGYTDPMGFGPGPYVRVNEGVNSYGKLGNYSEWEFKASVWGKLPWGVRGGLFWTIRAGDRYSYQYRISAMGNFGYIIRGSGQLDYRLMEGLEGQTVFLGRRGHWAEERQSIANLSLEKSFWLGGRRMSATADVFNLFRSEAVTERNTLANHPPIYWHSNLGDEWNGVRTRDRYGAVLGRVDPQTVRLGLMVYF